MLKELEKVPDTALPLAQLRGQLRLGSGFSDDDLQDELLIGALRAAVALIETHCAKVLIERDFELRIEHWRLPEAHPFPRAPVSRIVELVHGGSDGRMRTAAPERYRLVEDLHRPELRARGGVLPGHGAAGGLRLRFTAGFGPSWADVPDDLGLAVLQLAVRFYERRGGEEETVPLPAGVIRLLAPYRNLRLVAGRQG
ncbi:head-tail connector protein [Profundibacterium mesophilum]|uniref:Phage gp6-like head-tail connector protein n=1 Tax=Profundibacterium mesophilum KAUST100406-0324 TaxID=1037889 RepID=A0A921TGG2_9RHOB|nr:hypothetical protein [Profundibacterium mesophilum]KAF0677414.1 hypothetical protein PMES_00200 [Profundibacterium mesophilum KAUST100406-0324]